MSADRWALLGIAPTDDRDEIRRAYAKALKSIDVDADPAAFMALRQALEDSLAWGAATPFWEGEEWPEDSPLPDEIVLDGASGTEEPIAAAWDDDWWSGESRPALPDRRGGAVDAALTELDDLLFGEGVPDPQRVAALGQALLADPELENVGRLTEVEQWLVRAIAASPPRSDPLIAPAGARLGWDEARRHWRRDHDLDRILQRWRDLHFLGQCRRAGHVHHVALEELTGSPRSTLGLGELALSRDVAAFMEAVDSDHPSLLRDLDPDSVAWWRAYLHRRHLPADFWTLMCIGTLGLTLIGALAFVGPKGSPLLAASFLPLAAGLTFAIIFFVSDMLARRREAIKRRRINGDMDGPRRLGFVLCGLALPPLAAVLPEGEVSGWASLACAAALCAAVGWSAITRPPEFLFSTRANFLPVMAALIATQSIAILQDDATVRLLPPLIALAWIGYWGADSAQDWLLGAERGRRVAVVTASFALTLGTAAILATDSFPWPPELIVVALVPVAIIAAHLATSAGSIHAPWIEWLLRVPALIFYFASGSFIEQFGQGLFLTLSSYGLACALLHVSLALRQEWPAPADRRAAIE